MAVPPWPHAAEVTETHVFGCEGVSVSTTVYRRLADLPIPSTMRIYGDILVSHGRRKIGSQANSQGGWSIQASFDDVRAPFDNRVEVADPAVFRSYDACRNLIYGMLADGPVTGVYDLAPGNWGDQEFPPMDFADEIVRQIDGLEGVVRFDIAIHLPALLVCLVYSHPLALIRACKEAAPAAGTLAAPGQECAICHLELETGDEEIVRLPCFDTLSFHTPCIKPWFYRESKCPVCRREVMDYFSFRFGDLIDLGSKYELLIDYVAAVQIHI